MSNPFFPLESVSQQRTCFDGLASNPPPVQRFRGAARYRPTTQRRRSDFTSRPDIRDRASLEQNFRRRFEILNKVQLTDGEFQRLLVGITTPDVFRAARTLREYNSFVRDDGSPLNYTDKVIVTTIQKLGLALDGSNKRNYKERLDRLRHKRMVFIFDECHRSQFGENHKAIKEFFPNAQLFGFTGTPIFEENASAKQYRDDEGQFKTTEDLFQKQLHTYTITHAIEDQNVLRFHIDYYKGEGEVVPRPGEPLAKRAVVDAILAKHDSTTQQRRFNALFATASINDAIEHCQVFTELQKAKQAADPAFRPLNIACVFSPPAEGDKDVQQIQEDLPQEKADNEQDPEGKPSSPKPNPSSTNAP